MTTCKIVPLHKVIKEIETLIPQHYAEAKKEFNYEPIDIDFPYFMKLSKQGMCQAVVLKDGDKIVGYSIYIIASDPLRKNQLEANNVCMFVVKQFRGFGTVKLLMKAKAMLGLLGAKKTNYLIRNKALLKLLNKIGGEEQEKLVSVSA